MEKLPSGFSSGVQRCARCRWRGECQHSGKRSAADRTVLSGTGYGACSQSAAAELPCGKHGVLHQHQQGLSETCRVMGALLRRGLVWAGRIFAVLLGLQRAVTVQLDRSALRLGQLLTGGVPVIGQALSDTAEVFLAGMQLLKSSLGFAALAVIGAEFLPLYLQLLLHLLFLAGCRLLCGLAENRRCQALFDCMAEAVKCMAAVTALFFELLTVGVGLLMMTGGG